MEFGALEHRGGPEGPWFQGMPEKSLFHDFRVVIKQKKTSKICFALTIGTSFLNDFKRAEHSQTKK